MHMLCIWLPCVYLLKSSLQTLLCRWLPVMEHAWVHGLCCTAENTESGKSNHTNPAQHVLSMTDGWSWKDRWNTPVSHSSLLVLAKMQLWLLSCVSVASLLTWKCFHSFIKWWRLSHHLYYPHQSWTDGTDTWLSWLPCCNPHCCSYWRSRSINGLCSCCSHQR